MDDFEGNKLIAQFLEGRGSIWLVLLALWGGTASYISRIRERHEQFRTVELIGEWCISGFAGLISAYICLEFDASWQLTCFAAGMAGHMGGRAINVLEVRFKSMLGGKPNE